MTLSEAQSEIAKILRQLESDTDCVVKDIGCMSIEKTTVGDDRPKFQMMVVIELERLPGRDWA